MQAKPIPQNIINSTYKTYIQKGLEFNVFKTASSQGVLHKEILLVGRF